MNGIERYWAFQRECVNCALLEMIDVSLRHGLETNRPIYLLPRPTTKDQALRNLRAFSDEGKMNELERPSFFEPYVPSIRVNTCLGWTVVKGSSINRALERAKILEDVDNNHIYFAIVYHFVPKAELNADAILSQSDHFHITGFCNMPFNKANWLGDGVLVDFSDIVSPFADEREWDKQRYAMHKKWYHGAVRGLAEKRLL